MNKEKDAEKRFHKIQESYELLRDKEKRAQYDQFGASAFDANGNANPFAGQGGNPFGGFGEDQLEATHFQVWDLISKICLGKPLRVEEAEQVVVEVADHL